MCYSKNYNDYNYRDKYISSFLLMYSRNIHNVSYSDSTEARDRTHNGNRVLKEKEQTISSSNS
jgi:hypothetical protein